MELPLAPFFLKQLLLRRSDVNDLATLDSELYRNLMFLREYEGDVEDLALTFTASRQVYGANSEVSQTQANFAPILLLANACIMNADISYSSESRVAANLHLQARFYIYRPISLSPSVPVQVFLDLSLSRLETAYPA